MKKFIRTASVLIDVLAIIALVVYAIVDNVALDVACGVIIVIACILEIVHLLARKKHISPNL